MENLICLSLFHGLSSYENGHSHRREALAELLWPDRPETVGRNNLRQEIYRCRLALGDQDNSPPFLLTTARTLQINPNCEYWLDVTDFIQLVGAVQKHHPSGKSFCDSCLANLLTAAYLYRGNFLSGFPTFDSPAFEWWLLSQQESLHIQALEILSNLADYFESCNDYNSASLYLRRVISLEPWREDAHRQLMCMLALSGQHAASLRQFKECKRNLESELMTEPSPETIYLYECIRANKLKSLRDVPSSWIVRDSLTTEPEREKFTILAREREMAQIMQYLEGAYRGQGKVVFVTGEAGSGKTTLLQEIAYQAIHKQRDLLVAGGTCNAYTSVGDPYYPFIEILRVLTGESLESGLKSEFSEKLSQHVWAAFPDFLRAVIRHGPALVGTLITGESLLSAARAHSQISQYELKRLEILAATRIQNKRWIQDTRDTVFEHQSGVMIEIGGPRENQFPFIDQLTQVIISLARRHPLVLIIDDMQWLDHASASGLIHLASRLRSSPIFILGAFRSEGSLSNKSLNARPLDQVIQELMMHESAVEIDLAETDGKAFVDAYIDTEPNDLSEKFRQRLFSLTRGHAMFTVEVLRGMQERGDLLINENKQWIQGSKLCWEQIPTKVDAAISERLQYVSEGDQNLLSVASVQGKVFTAEVVACVLGMGLHQILIRLSGVLAKNHKLVSALGVQRIGELTLSQFCFNHELHQKHLYQKLDAVELTRLHQATGQELETLMLKPSIETRQRIAGVSTYCLAF
jgi:DNA-binding SARP family transcriptional activator/energy-coupling factor transporter ATP-binding protein EcfA2